MSTDACHTLQLETDNQRTFQEREWLAETIGWLLMGLVAVVALLGLLGPGLLSYRNATSSDGELALEYYAVERFDSPAELRIDAQRSKTDQSPMRLVVSRSFRDAIELLSIVPEPLQVESSGTDLVFVFASKSSGSERIVLRYKSAIRGWLSAKIGIENLPALEFQQFVLP